MMRYLRVYRAIIRSNFIGEMTHRTNFIMGFFSGILYLLTGLGLFLVVFLRLSMFGDWNAGDMFIFVGTTYLIDVVWMTFFFFNMLGMPEKINSGKFDLLLTKPLNTQFLVTCERINLESGFNSLIGIGLIVYGIYIAGYDVTVVSLLTYLFLLANGVMLFYSTFLMINCIAFWQTKFKFAWDLIEWFYEFAMKPDVIYRGSVRFILTYFLPAMMLVSFPARALMGKLDLSEVLWGLLATTILFVACQWVWKRAIANYTSASS
ncbi:ABC-2 family transporter protein [Tumebacillus sp. DT12]|uniref:ABC-2 family transporter protein n=1 Tax=Tumebacillus lacus TaxID=2995335 RepID=A0ABT3WZZ6_9BACL|nr:ABC-2 family transporter protein [Tumebacillus lacus]MCX7570226.1 ABC-2 family transporter protein [Tumebacillus lacus]